MKLIWKIFVRDVRQATRNVIAVIVAMGLAIVPALYAWYNIAASWDPYGNTKALKVAVANVDKGYKSGLMPITINVGETVTSTLRANHDLDWQFVDRAKAIDGVNSGEYYAALIIPKSFSSDMMTLFSPKIKHAKLEYYLNEKINPIAPHITDQGAATVATQGKGVAGVTRLGEERHEGFRPHPAAGEGTMNEKEGRLAGLATGQAGENFKAVDNLCF